MPIRYDVNNWYWQVSGDTNYWSSSRFMYVPPTDATYQSWLGSGGEPTMISSQDELGQVMVTQRIPSYLLPGLAVESTSNNTLDSTYALDEVTLSQVGIVSRDYACGFGLPLNAPTFAYPDIRGNHIVFTATEIQKLYRAMRDYIANVSYAVSNLVHGFSATLPTQPVHLD